MRAVKPERRVERTRRAILDAFRHLILTQGYDPISVRDVVEAAGVGRSTFYEHFEHKDDLFQESVRPLLSVLAHAVDDGPAEPMLAMVIEHFGHNRRLARTMMAGSPGRLMARFLAELIEERLSTLARETRATRPLIALPLIAVHLAEAQLGLIGGWLSAKTACAPEALAHALQLSTHASAAALLARKTV
jgi:AcrR family transcriptional regulator